MRKNQKIKQEVLDRMTGKAICPRCGQVLDREGLEFSCPICGKLSFIKPKTQIGRYPTPFKNTSLDSTVTIAGALAGAFIASSLFKRLNK